MEQTHDLRLGHRHAHARQEPPQLLRVDAAIARHVEQPEHVAQLLLNEQCTPNLLVRFRWGVELQAAEGLEGLQELLPLTVAMSLEQAAPSIFAAEEGLNSSAPSLDDPYNRKLNRLQFSPSCISFDELLHSTTTTPSSSPLNNMDLIALAHSTRTTPQLPLPVLSLSALKHLSL